MCLAVPARVEEVHDSWATVNLNGTLLQVNTQLVSEVKPDNFLLVHAGYAIQVIDEAEAWETLALLEAVYGSE
ncbi:HypC/HybG/HupF family hydrogenase formation chaperone [Paradesulfitobacterium aromaticivorans]